MARRGLLDPDRGLAVEALLVERALAGDDQVRAGERLLEADQLQDGLDARSLLGVEQREGGEAGTARGSGAGCVAQVATAGRGRDKPPA